MKNHKPYSSFLAMTVALFALLIAHSSLGTAQTPNWLWTKGAGGTSDDEGRNIAVDANGNSYVTGLFGSPTITFGSTTLTNDSSGTADIFVVKYDASGNVVWAKSAGGASDDRGNGIAVDANGNSYVTGYFYSSTITFGSTTLTNHGTFNIFVVKYDASGNVVWAKSAGGTSGDDGQDIAVDANGNSYVTGYFYSSTLTFGSTTLTNNGAGDIFVVKYDASGNVVWAKSAGGTDADEGLGIAVDANGNTYATGRFNSSTITFGSTTLTNDSSGTADIYVVKYDASGNVVWAKSAGGTDWDEGTGVAADANGNSYVTGYFWSPTITFGSTTLTSNGWSDIFVVKYDASGNVAWAKSAGGTNYDYGYGITVDANGNSYVTGEFQSSTITFGSTTLTNDSSGTADIFVAKYDASGNVVWAKSAGGTNYDVGIGIAVDASGNSYATGYFDSSPITFGSTILTNNGGDDVFVGKIGSAQAPTPALVSPANGATYQPTTSTLRWSHVALADSYRLQLATDSNFVSGIFLDDSTVVDTFKAVSGLLTATKYYWRVNARNVSGTSPWSGVWNFKTIAPLPPTITSFAPTSGAVGSTVTIDLVNFSRTLSDNIVTFGGVQAQVTSSTTISLLVTVPAGAAYAPITVTDKNSGLTAYTNTPFLPTFPDSGSTIDLSSFADTVSFLVGHAPSAIAIGDFDGDGKPDLAVSDAGSDSVSILRNTSAVGSITSSSFAPRVNVQTGRRPNGIAVGDFDGDGKLDIAVANYNDNTVSILLNASTVGTISFLPKIDVTVGTNPFAVAVGDLDKDGRPDIVCSNYNGSSISLLENKSTKGTISFAPAAQLSVGNNPLGCVLADLNGDGKPDIVVANQTAGSLSIFRNISRIDTLSFINGGTIPIGGSTPGVAAGDLDGDGALDLAVNDVTSASLIILRNTSSADTITFVQQAATIPTGKVPLDGALSSLSGRSKPDIAVLNQQDKTISVFRNTSTVGNISFAPKEDFPIGGGGNYLAAGDIDGDGKSDLVVVNDSGYSVSVLRNRVAPFSTPSVPILISPSNGASGQATSPTLQWNQSAGAANYCLQVSTASDFSAFVFDDSTLTDTVHQIGPLAYNTTYYWHVRGENGGGWSTFSIAMSFTTLSTVALTPPVVSFPSTPASSTSYRLFSYPGITSMAVGSLVSGSQGTDWRVLWDNGNASNYWIQLGASDEFIMGKGYWLLKAGDLNLSSRSISMPSLTNGTEISIPLHGGWNIIANPFERDVPWSTVWAANSLSPADTLWDYAGSFNQTGTMSPFHGYYFLNGTGDTSLKIPYPFSVAVPKAPPSTSEWKVRIVFDSDINNDPVNYIGIDPGVRDKFGWYNTRKPPAVFDQGFLYFLHPEWDAKCPRFSSDVRTALGDGQVWDFEVSNPRKSGAKITFKNVEQIPAGNEVILINQLNTTPVDVRLKNEYVYSTVIEKMPFKLIVGKKQFVDKEIVKLLPDKFELMQNFPNPFNPTTSISFKVPGEAQVRLIVYSVLGERIKTLADGPHSPAVYTVSWDGTNESGSQVASGLYLCRLVVNGKNIQTRKLLFLK